MKIEKLNELIAKTEDHIDLFCTHVAVAVQHGNAVEQVPCVDHEDQRKGLDGVEDACEQISQHKFRRACKHRHAGQRGKVCRMSQGFYIDTIGDAQKQEPRHDRDGMGEGADGGLLYFLCICLFHR